MFVSIDLHSEKPCFSVQFVDTYSIYSFPPPARRTQQIQPFSQSGAGVCPPVSCHQFRIIANKHSSGLRETLPRLVCTPCLWAVPTCHTQQSIHLPPNATALKRGASLRSKCAAAIESKSMTANVDIHIMFLCVANQS